MILKPIKFKTIIKSPINKIIIWLGGFIAFFSLMSLVQLTITASLDNDSLSDVWLRYMPILALIGVAYLFFGLFFHKIKKQRLLIHIVISLLSIVWLILYTISLNASNPLPDPISEPFDYKIESIFYYGGIIVAFLFMISSQIFIGLKIKRENINATYRI